MGRLAEFFGKIPGPRTLIRRGTKTMVQSKIGEISSNWVTLNLDGRFDTSTAPKIRTDSLRIALAKDVQQFEINFAGIVCADSSCVAVMLEVFRAIRAKGGRVRFTGIDANTLRMISLSGLDELFSSIVVSEVN
jgi:anti-anti-sigma factor